MLTIRNSVVAAGVTLGLLALSVTVRATTITQVLNIPGGSNAAGPPVVNDIGYNLFDSTLGTLTSVTLDLATTDTVTSSVVNATGSNQAVTGATAAFAMSIYGPPATALPPYDLTTYLSTFTITAGPFSNPSVSPGVTDLGTASGPTDSGPVNVPSADWLGNFEAPGDGPSSTDFVFATGTGQFGGHAASFVFFGGSASVNGTLTLVYTYQPPVSNGTPEPGSWALLVATASVSIAGIRRRRAVK